MARSGIPGERQSARILAQNLAASQAIRPSIEADPCAREASLGYNESLQVASRRPKSIAHRSRKKQARQAENNANQHPENERSEPAVPELLEAVTEYIERQRDLDYGAQIEGNAQECSDPVDCPLGEAVHVKYDMSQLQKAFDDGLIDLEAEYQRGVVWPVSNMSGFIKSLVENFFIPPIIFGLKRVTLSNGQPGTLLVCVDGKQRLTSIDLFLKGELPYVDSQGTTWWYRDSALAQSKNGKILPEKNRLAFRRRILIAYEYENLTTEQEEDLFARVQKGVPLNPSEKLRATQGAWQSLARAFEREFPLVTSLSVNNRAAGFRHFVTSFAQICEVFDAASKGTKPKAMVSLPATTKFCKSRDHSSAEAEHFREIFSAFSRLATNAQWIFQERVTTPKRDRRFAPLEFVAVAVLIANVSNDHNDRVLTRYVEQLRAHLRRSLSELRLDNNSWNVAWEFIEGIERHQDGADGADGAHYDADEPNATIASSTADRRAINFRAIALRDSTRPSTSRKSSTQGPVWSPPQASPRDGSPLTSYGSAADVGSSNQRGKRSRAMSLDSVLGASVQSDFSDNDLPYQVKNLPALRRNNTIDRHSAQDGSERETSARESSSKSKKKAKTAEGDKYQADCGAEYETNVSASDAAAGGHEPASTAHRKPIARARPSKKLGPRKKNDRKRTARPSSHSKAVDCAE